MEVSNSLPVANQVSTPAQQAPDNTLQREKSNAANQLETQENSPSSGTAPAPVADGEQPDTAALQAAGERVGTLLDVQA